MGHNVNYTGKLFLKKPLTETQIEKFKLLQDDDKNFDRLYAVTYFDKSTEWYFEVNNKYEKLYPISNGFGLFESLKKYLELESIEIVEYSFIMCCSEYGFSDDEEVLVFHIQNGSICFTPIRDIVSKFVKSLSTKN